MKDKTGSDKYATALPKKRDHAQHVEKKGYTSANTKTNPKTAPKSM